MKEPRRKAGGMQRRPEAIARAREVKPGGGGIEAWVDAAEEDLQPRRDDVAQPFVGCGLEINLGGPA